MNAYSVTPEQIRASLASVIEPGFGVNIVDLGLVYAIHATEDRIDIDLTLPRPDSPLVASIAADVEQTVRAAFEDVETVEVSLIWDPPWSFDRLTDKGKEALGLER